MLAVAKLYGKKEMIITFCDSNRFEYNLLILNPFYGLIQQFTIELREKLSIQNMALINKFVFSRNQVSWSYC